MDCSPPVSSVHRLPRPRPPLREAARGRRVAGGGRREAGGGRREAGGARRGARGSLPGVLVAAEGPSPLAHSRGRGAHHPSADSSSLQFPVVPWILLARHSHGDQRVLGGSPHLGQFCSCEALAKLLDLSKPQLSHLQAFQKQELLLSVKPTSALPMRPTPKPDRV